MKKIVRERLVFKKNIRVFLPTKSVLNPSCPAKAQSREKSKSENKSKEEKKVKKIRVKDSVRIGAIRELFLTFVL